MCTDPNTQGSDHAALGAVQACTVAACSQDSRGNQAQVGARDATNAHTCLLGKLVSSILQALGGAVSTSLEALASLLGSRFQLLLIEALSGWHSVVCYPLSARLQALQNTES